MYISGDLSSKSELIIRIIAEFVAGFGSYALLGYILSPIPVPGPVLSDEIPTHLAFTSEIFTTLLLIVLYMSTCEQFSLFSSCAINSVWVVYLVIIGEKLTGASMNPMVSICWTLLFGETSMFNLKWIYVYLVATVLGGMLGGLFWKHIFSPIWNEDRPKQKKD